jgi:serine protease Do
MKRVSILVVGLTALAMGGALVASPKTVVLGSGAQVTGDMLDERADRVVIDLGFTVLTIPAGEIQSVQAGGEPAAEPSIAVDDGGLFRVATDPRPASVEDNAARLGGAVVQVRTPTGLGSGFVIHPDGYVVTNDHVVAGEYEITVTVYEQAGSSLDKLQYNHVRIVALDPQFDLALLQIQDAGGRVFTAAPIGNSDTLQGGETVFAIGSPLGLERTVSQGIVSLKNRPLGGRLLIQTTTQINPGNSGGPLFNLRGEVVGVNNMKAMMFGVEGVSFAIPAATLKEFLRNRDAFAFDTRNPNAGFRYLEPPKPVRKP